MFGVAIQIALKMVTKKYLRLVKDLYQLLQTSISDWSNKISEKSRKYCNILGSKTSENDLLALNYGFPSSFTTLSTWRSTKRG